MSAPWEVWVVECIDGYCEAHLRFLPPATIRFLRADLTCGECSGGPVGAWFINQGGCSTWTHRPSRNTPACMAFQPKEKP